MAVDLFQPILNDRTRSVNFFNGRLLTGEDLTAEQKANKAAHALLGQALGAGVAYGFEVSESALSSTTQAPVLAVTQGLAINRRGTALLLGADTEIALVRPPGAADASSIFADCVPAQAGVYVAGAGLYLLTAGPASASQGLAEVSGVGSVPAPCNSKYNAEGVQFRLIPLTLTQDEINDANHLQNLLAYQCFGLDDWDPARVDQFVAANRFGLMDQLRASGQLTDCEVPLAALYWTATGGLVFVDMWAVRRRLTAISESTRFRLAVDGQVDSAAEAAFLQFQAQLASIRRLNASPQSVKATTYFRYLPAAGILPVFTGGGGSTGFDYLQFFAGATFRNPVFVNGARLERILRDSLRHRPIDLSNGELIWLYLVRENRQPLAGAGANPAQPYIVFVTGHAPYYGDAHFNVAHWDYSNYF